MTNPTGYTELDLVGFTDKGEYSPSANYVQNDIVQYNYVAWRCKVDDTTGITPTEGTNWTVFVGNPPLTSVTGVKGNAESTYRSGNVNLTPANIGAYSKSEVDTALNGKLGTSGASTNTTVAFTSNDLAANTTVKTNTTTNQPSTVAKLSSNETLASMFNKISSMFASIRKLWNTVGSTAIDTAYGATLTAQMANLKSYNTYSTSETWTGKYWIDGKKIYQRTVSGTFSVSVTNSIVEGSFNLQSGVDTLVLVHGTVQRCTKDRYYYVPFTQMITSLQIFADVNVIKNNQNVAKCYYQERSSTAATGLAYSITIEYTKTT